MTALALVRHGPTAWTESRRIQGRADQPLSPAGRRRVAAWRLPTDLAGFAWASSPLERARQTAALLGADAPAIEPRLAEMDWGAWEGRRLADLRRELGAEMTANEKRGLDFRPPRGESPRDVQARLGPWLAELAAAGRPTIAVTHRGVIRAVLALATHWDMTAAPPVKLGWAAAHVFTVEAGGGVAVEALNRDLEPS